MLEVLDDYLRTLNSSWANSSGHGMELIRYVFRIFILFPA